MGQSSLLSYRRNSTEILPEEGLSVIISTDKCAVLAAMVYSLVCAFVVHLQQNQVFLQQSSFKIRR